MPKRLIDGDRIWTSNKIAEIEPESYRPEYANLLPLGLANGSFECNENRVWRDVYAFNRPSVSVDDVVDILDEFERVRLLFRWHDDQGKIWGFWVGIKSGGLLPPQTQQKDYKKGLEPPAELLERFLSGEIQTGLTLGRTYATTREPQGKPLATPREPQDGFGIGMASYRLGEDDKNDTNPSLQKHDGQGELMKLKKQISLLCRKNLGVRPEPYDNVWDDMSELEEIYSRAEVVAAFDDWSKPLRGEILDRPLSQFLKIADGILSGILSVEVDSSIDDLATQLAVASKGSMAFDSKQRMLLAKGLKKGTQAEIVQALKNFLKKQDDFSMKRASQVFADTVVQELAVVQDENRIKTSEAAAAARAKELLEQEGEAERAARKRAREEEEALVEDVLE